MTGSAQSPFSEAEASPAPRGHESPWLNHSGSLVLAAPEATLARIRPGIARLDWRVRFSDCPATALSQIGKAPLGSVYAIAFTGDAGDPERLLTPLRSVSSRVPGIALVEPGLLESESIRRLIIEHFDAWLPLPIEPAELVSCARNLLRIQALTESVRRGRQRRAAIEGLQGESEAMQRLMRTIERVSDSEAPVLILGETGTGKELVARAIHQGSARAAGPLVAVNCGAIAPTLLQAELFGHEKHAFTGAMQRRAGSFEAADRGSVFLDEIGELPVATQPALLRVLQERSVTRLGSTQAVPVDFRLIAATHVELPKAIAAGQFREDLFFRINVLTVQVPPLRDRDDDAVMLAESFRQRMVDQSRGSGPRGFDREALESLRRHDWPGNVRELLNRVQRAVVMAESRLIGAADLGLASASVGTKAAPLSEARSRLERFMITQSLRRNGQSVAGAARQLGVSRVTLYRMMARLNIGSTGNDGPDSPGVCADRVSAAMSEPAVSKLKLGRYAS